MYSYVQNWRQTFHMYSISMAEQELIFKLKIGPYSYKIQHH